MFIDKFYRLYNPYIKQVGEPRASTTNLNFGETGWDARNQRIGRVKDGIDSDDVSTVGQTLTRKGDEFVQGQNKYEFIELKDQKWNAKKRKISNLDSGENADDAVTLSQVPKSLNSAWDFKYKILQNIKPGELENDAAVLGQVIVYDRIKKVFKCGFDEIDIVVNTPSNPVLVADENTNSGLRKYKGEEYKHKNHVYNLEGKLSSSGGATFSLNKGIVTET